jgi:hypothetical protein
MQDTVINLGVNSAAVAVLGWWVQWELRSRLKDEAQVSKEDGLSRLQV